MDCYPYTIIGGGVAGLSAANCLADLGLQPLLLEGSSYPKRTVCGEFLSASAVALLAKWDIKPPVAIPAATFYRNDQPLFNLPFSPNAGAMPRDMLESSLLKRALEKGVEIRTNTKVQNIRPTADGAFELQLENGVIHTTKLLVSAGRFFQETQKPIYIGMRAHFHHVKMPCRLDMHLIDKGYMGIVPIGNNQINVAILCRGEPLIPTNIEGTISDEGWVKVALPPFAKKRVPKWKNSYFFGDTLATIPPITGQGVALALYMGMEAAKKAVAGDVMVNPYKRQLFIGKLLHQVALKAPALSNALKWSPRLAHAAKRLTEIF